eukprot:2830980-Ditylum_brightwellii.AAC.2
MMSHQCTVNGTQPDDEYKSQFIWDDNEQETITNLEADMPTEKADEARGTLKVGRNTANPSKHGKKEVKSNTQDDVTTQSVKEIPDRCQV